jgi:hypothetical protein
MSAITEIRVDFARTFVPPGGDRYQPLKIAAGLTVAVEPGEDVEAVKRTVQIELRQIIEETYRSQVRPKREEAAA